MAVTTEGYFVCDFCGDDHGSFDEKGNHVSCTEISALRSKLVECEKVADAAIDAIRNTGERHFFTDEIEAIELYEAYKSAHPTEKG